MVGASNSANTEQAPKTQDRGKGPDAPLTERTTLNVSSQFSGDPIQRDAVPIGANGCGKSTFVKILCGELEPSAGSVAIESN